MSVSKFNNEGYYDPVVYEALTKGRRNWLFCDTTDGADASMMFCQTITPVKL